jgi:large subunit ribosomal protein L32
MVQMKRHTSSAQGKSRSKLALKASAITKCPQCGKAVKPHHACSFCGYYRGKKILKVSDKKKSKKTTS